MKKLLDKEVKVGILILCVSFACLIHVSCHKKCKDYTFYETAPVILEYFGNYQPGNYWIYENQDGTKRDSIWVSDYVEREGGDDILCIRYPTRKFTLNSKYIGNPPPFNVIIDNRNQGERTYIICEDSFGRSIFSFTNEGPEAFKDIAKPDVGLTRFFTKEKDTFSLIKYAIK